MASPYSYGAKSTKKQRFVAGVVTPASPNYVHGLVEDGAESVTTDDIKPLLGVARSKLGYTVRAHALPELVDAAHTLTSALVRYTKIMPMRLMHTMGM